MNSLTQNEQFLIDKSEDQFFNNLRQKEYARLDDQHHIYLDYTGGNLYAECQLKDHHELLKNSVLGNPHSTNPTSQSSTRLAEAARKKVIEFFHAEDYCCIFTQNASGALKIVGESYPFADHGHFLLISDNHNSVNGIREYCRSKGGTFKYCPIHYEDLTIDSISLNNMLDEYPMAKNKLFAFPAQSNVSGVKHDLEWIEKAQRKGWDVLLDAAAFVPTNRLDLSKVKPDFVSVSFYKIFGYPTGLGCLLVKRSTFDKLQKPWFAGGTVTLASVRASSHYLAGDHERFEDGTINYLDLPAVKIGLDYIDSIGIDRINKRVSELAQLLYQKLLAEKYESGRHVVKVFGPVDFAYRGGTIIMNFYHKDGSVYPFEELEKMANSRMISLRSGCFCNPGIDEVNNCISNEELAKYFSSHKSGDYHNMIEFLGKMRGATRVSVGLATTTHDIDKFMDLIKNIKTKLA
ncbi:MAG: aminotransferase class V-fold PLP-dependent enzyme [Bacteroidetes bacterium]|nr:aminotransferase class V-fold PLP-dependent enzyme [Bacteroidota bacterium]